MEYMTTLSSGSGFWHPLLWLTAFVVVVVLAVIIRSFGARKYKMDTEQTKPFLSGNDESDPNEIHVRAGNLYWGYLETLKGYYEKMISLHTGNPADYLLWLFGVLALVVLIGLLA
ncbi:hydrogenase [bacterium]|nr:hydrogenase [bacterium]